MRSSSRSCRTFVRRGLTMLELVVVMSILAALAAIVIPMFPNMITQAHTSAAATNVGEVSKAVQAYYGQTNFYPNNLDSLIVAGTNTLFTALPSNAMTFTGSQIAADLLVTTPTASDVAALNSAGITSVLNMQAGANASGSVWSPTFYPYGDGTAIVQNGALTTSAPIATPITPTAIPSLASLSLVAAQRLGLLPANATAGAPTNTFYVFGLGGYSSMQGTAIGEAPIHWMSNMAMNGTTMNMSPSNVYSRFGLVFQTSSGGTALSSAKFVGTILLTGQGVANSSKPMSNFLGTQTQP